MATAKEPPDGIGRRAFLEAAVSAGGGVAALGLGACSAQRRDELPLDPGGLADYIADLDQLRASASTSFVSAALAERDGAAVGRDADGFTQRADALARRAIETLTVGGMLLDLPEEARGAPQVQAYLDQVGGGLDATVLDVAHLLSTYPDDELEHAQRVLRDDPDLVMLLCERLDACGRSKGLSAGARRRLRAIARRATNRVRDEDGLRGLLRDLLATAEANLTAQGEELPGGRWPASEAVAGWWGGGGALAESVAKEEGRPATTLPCSRASGDGYVVTGDCEEQGHGTLALEGDGEGRPANPYAGDPRYDVDRLRRRRRAGWWLFGVGAFTSIGLAFIPLSMGFSSIPFSIGFFLIVAAIPVLVIEARRRRELDAFAPELFEEHE
jgi:hypothetical protein